MFKNKFFLQVIVIGMLQAVEIKNSAYNFGNVPFELLVQENTKVENIGTFSLKQTFVPEKIDNMEDAVPKIGKYIS